MPTRLLSRSFGSIAVRTPLAAPGQKIGLIGGSFNPPHRAHLAISEAVLKRLRLDQVWWLVSPGNPLKAHDDLAPLPERMAACKRLVTDPRIKITALEAGLGSAYTAVTLSFLRRRFPAVHFVWVMGGDNLAGFHRWTAWRGIAALMPIAVADRPHWRLRALASPAARALARYRLDDRKAGGLALGTPPSWTYLGIRQFPDSSTEIRSGRRADASLAAAQLPNGAVTEVQPAAKSLLLETFRGAILRVARGVMRRRGGGSNWPGM